MSTTRADTLVAALQAALAGEHAAVWACSRAAAVLGEAGSRAALGELEDHRRARDALRRRLLALGADPVEAPVAHLEPHPVTGRRRARGLLAHVAAGLCAAYADLAGASGPGERGAAVTEASAAARRALSWGGESEAFPGSAPAPQPLPSEGDQS